MNCNLKSSAQRGSLLRAVFFATAVLLSTGAPAGLHAAAFHVDCDHGSDRATGRTAETAWQHLQAVNEYAADHGFGPGDSILLKRGCRWREELDLLNTNSSGALRNSGIADKPIVIASYGAGDLPTIDGADLLAGWKNVAPGVFAASIAGPVYKVFVDGDQRETNALHAQPNFLGPWSAGNTYGMWDYVTSQGKTFAAMRDVADKGHIKSEDWFHAADLTPDQQASGVANVTRTAGSCYLDSAKRLLYLHLPDGSDPGRHKIQVTRRRYGVQLQGVSHVTVDGLRIIHAGKSGVLASVYAPNQGGAYMTDEYNTVRNSIFWNNSDTTMDVLPGTGTQGEGAIYVAASSKPDDRPLNGWVIENNAVGMLDSERISSFTRSGISVTGTSGLLLRNNYVATNHAVGASVFTDRGPRCMQPLIQGNDFAANQGNLRISGCTNPVADSNTIAYSYGYGIQTGGNTTGAQITHNLIHHLTITPKAGLYNGFDCNGGAPGGTLAYNTIEAVWAAEATLEKGCDHWTVRQNIFDSSNNAQHGGLTLYIRQEALPGMVFDQNVYRVDPNVKRQFNVGAGQPGGQTFHDISWWQANQEKTAQPAQTPLFANSAAGDYSLRAAAVRGRAAITALPVHPFTPTAASTTYLREAANLPWEPQDQKR